MVVVRALLLCASKWLSKPYREQLAAWLNWIYRWLMPKLKVGHISPTHDEDAAINAGIAADHNAEELDDEWFGNAKPASELLLPEICAALIAKQL